MSYVLIEFNNGGGVAVVRNTWLTPRKKEVFWPPVKDQKTFDKILQNTIHADTENWKLYPIVRCLFDTDDLQKARQKCKLSEDTSDLQTDNQEVETFKRKIIMPRRFISSDEEEISDNVHVRPPKLKKKFLSTNQKTPEKSPIFRQNSSDADSSEVIEQIHNTPRLNTCNTVTSRSTRFHTHKASTSYITPIDSSTESVDSSEVIEQTLRNRTNSTPKLNICNTITSRSTAAHRNRPYIRDTSPTDSSTESIVFQEKIIRLLTHIKTQNSQLLALLQNKEEVLPSQKDFAFQFPMKSLHDVDQVEEILKEKTQIDILNTSLSTIGGRDVSSKVSRILKYLFIDTLAAKFSFYGKRLNKRPFSDLCLRTVIVESIKPSTPTGITNKEIEDSIKIWLKHAPDRQKNQMRRNNQNDPNLNNIE